MNQRSIWLLIGLALCAPNPALKLAAQQPSCLHGPSESDAQRARKRAALSVARQINTFENAAFQSTGMYRPLQQLSGLNNTPEAFEIHAAIEPSAYAFVVKDTIDPCGFAYFSDESGLIYTGESLR
jgi:hypothetical protein